MESTERLAYLRRATLKRDGGDGFLYRHHWATGWQELIFSTHDAATSFRNAFRKAAE